MKNQHTAVFGKANGMQSFELTETQINLALLFSTSDNLLWAERLMLVHDIIYITEEDPDLDTRAGFYILKLAADILKENNRKKYLATKK